jgi:hypothetical protein
MVEITLNESAWEDLDSITDYIAQDSLTYAQKFSDDLFDYIEQLKLIKIQAVWYLSLITQKFTGQS